MPKGYVEISKHDFVNKMVELKFIPVSIPGTNELVYERQIPNARSHWNGNYAIRIYSSILGDRSRELGTDAIRVLIINKESDSVLSKDFTVYRTQNALDNLETRCREIWKYATSEENRCPKCGRILHIVTPKNRAANRKQPFIACSGYSYSATTVGNNCKFTKSIP